MNMKEAMKKLGFPENPELLMPRGMGAFVLREYGRTENWLVVRADDWNIRSDRLELVLLMAMEAPRLVRKIKELQQEVEDLKEALAEFDDEFLASEM